MSWWAASILANFAIAVVEYLNRVGGYPDFLRAVMVTGPFIVAAQFGLFYAWRDAPSFMFAWAFFTAGNLLLRLISAQLMIGEPLTWPTIAGVSAMLAGAYLVKIGSVG